MNNYDEGMFVKACREENENKIRQLANGSLSEWELNTGFVVCCGKGNVDMVKFLIGKGANDWNRGLDRACMEGNVKIAKLMVVCGANKFKWALSYAVDRNHIELLKYLLCLNISKWDLLEVVERACKQGKMEILKLVEEKYPNSNVFSNWSVLGDACEGGNREILDFILPRMDGNHWDTGLFGACRGGHLEIVKEMLGRGAKNVNEAMCSACYKGSLPIVKLLVEHGATNWYWGLKNATQWTNNIELVKYLLDRMDDQEEPVRKKRKTESIGEAFIDFMSDTKAQEIARIKTAHGYAKRYHNEEIAQLIEDKFPALDFTNSTKYLE